MVEAVHQTPAGLSSGKFHKFTGTDHLIATKITIAVAGSLLYTSPIIVCIKLFQNSFRGTFGLFSQVFCIFKHLSNARTVAVVQNSTSVTKILDSLDWMWIMKTLAAVPYYPVSSLWPRPSPATFSCLQQSEWWFMGVNKKLVISSTSNWPLSLPLGQCFNVSWTSDRFCSGNCTLSAGGRRTGTISLQFFYLIIIIRSKNEKNLPKTKFVNLWFDGIWMELAMLQWGVITSRGWQMLEINNLNMRNVINTLEHLLCL